MNQIEESLELFVLEKTLETVQSKHFNALLNSLLRSLGNGNVERRGWSCPLPWCRTSGVPRIPSWPSSKDLTSIPSWPTAVLRRRTAAVRCGLRSHSRASTEEKKMKMLIFEEASASAIPLICYQIAKSDIFSPVGIILKKQCTFLPLPGYQKEASGF